MEIAAAMETAVLGPFVSQCRAASRLLAVVTASCKDGFLGTLPRREVGIAMYIWCAFSTGERKPKPNTFSPVLIFEVGVSQRAVWAWRNVMYHGTGEGTPHD